LQVKFVLGFVFDTFAKPVTYIEMTVKILTYLACVLPIFASAQSEESIHRCGATDYQAQLMNDPEYAAQHAQKLVNYNLYVKNKPADSKMDCDEILYLPVAVHFQNVTINMACAIDMALSQIDRLNADFAGTNADIDTWNALRPVVWPGIQNKESCIQFCLATLNHPASSGLNDDQFAITINQTTGSSDPAWAGYVNFFVRPMDNPLGFSPLGGTGNGDGVTCGLIYFGEVSCGGNTISTTYNMGRTITHEVGHYLLLDHPFNATGCADDINDFVDDTPNTDQETFGCPADEFINCTEPVLWPSYMDYCDDQCMFMFSAGQVDRMENYVNSSLQNLLTNAVSKCQEVACIDYNVQVTQTSESCAGLDGRINLLATGGTTPYSFSISDGANFQNNGIFQNLIENEYIIEVSDNNGCVFLDTITLGRAQATINLASTKDAFCGDNSGTLEVAVSEPGTFEYSINGVPGWREVPIFENLVAGVYTVLVQNEGNCTGSLNVLIEDDSDLNLIVRNIQPVNCPLFDNGAIIAELGTGQPPYVYRLNDENPSDKGVYTDLSPGAYILSVEDNRGCALDFGFNINVSFANIASDCPCQMYIPNAMTPDGDGTNDLLRIVPSCPITEFRLQVFDRWGTMLFESDELETRWNGGYNGYYVEAGIYIYKVSYRWGESLNSSLDVLTTNGTIQIIR